MKKLAALSLLFLIFGCKNQEIKNEPTVINLPTYQIQNKLNWLIGSWVNSNEFGTMTESWTLKNDSTLSGIVTAAGVYQDSISGEMKNFVDTLEEISLEERNGIIFYVPAVRDQNMGLPVKFKLVVENDSMVQFNNPNHDFPQTITYKKLRPDSICGVISGDLNGSFVEEFFPFKKL